MDYAWRVKVRHAGANDSALVVENGQPRVALPAAVLCDEVVVDGPPRGDRHDHELGVQHRLHLGIVSPPPALVAEVQQHTLPFLRRAHESLVQLSGGNLGLRRIAQVAEHRGVHREAGHRKNQETVSPVEVYAGSDALLLLIRNWVDRGPQ